MRPTFRLDWRDLPVPGSGGTSALRSSKCIEWRRRSVLADRPIPPALPGGPSLLNVPLYC